MGLRYTRYTYNYTETFLHCYTASCSTATLKQSVTLWIRCTYICIQLHRNTTYTQILWKRFVGLVAPRDILRLQLSPTHTPLPLPPHSPFTLPIFHFYPFTSPTLTSLSLSHTNNSTSLPTSNHLPPQLLHLYLSHTPTTLPLSHFYPFTSPTFTSIFSQHVDFCTSPHSYLSPLLHLHFFPILPLYLSPFHTSLSLIPLHHFPNLSTPPKCLTPPPHYPSTPSPLYKVHLGLFN